MPPIEPALVIDCRGELCPLPVARARQALRSAAPGAIVELLCSDPMAELDLAALCAREGHEWLGAQPAGAAGISAIRLRRTDCSTPG